MELINKLHTYLDKLILLSKDILELSLPEDYELLSSIINKRDSVQKKAYEIFNLEKKQLRGNQELKEKVVELTLYDEKISKYLRENQKALQNEKISLFNNKNMIERFNLLKKNNSSTLDFKI